MNQEALDKATQVREGENLAEQEIKACLEHQLGQKFREIEIQQFPGGYSNLTYLIRLDEQEFVLRKPPRGANIKSAHDMGREFKVLSLLKPVYPFVPSPVLYEESSELLGAPFYVMERVKGIILRNRPPKGIDLQPELMGKISRATIDHLASLHSLDLEKSGLADFGKPEGYVQRQVEGWVKRYFNAETDEVGGMNAAAEWLQANIPSASQAAFIHNDFKYDNLVLDPIDLSRIIAVLDWEMATVGDPLMDLGTSLAYWIEAKDSDALKPFSLTWLPGNLTREEAVERYADKMGLKDRNMLFYYVFGSFKVGVIAQQIYARFKQGFTKDPRFGMLIHSVRACGQNAQLAIQFNRISNLY
ncbi:MAG: phosphotransferase family protein [Bacteroidia bacterium]|nr:phosphotransferase family protein [Bacteroidia bacterium]